MTGKLPSFFKETIEAMLNLCLTVYLYCARLHVLKCCINCATICWGDIVIELNATKKHLYLLYIARKVSFLLFKNVNVDQLQYT